jgi:hypothetical protein
MLHNECPHRLRVFMGWVLIEIFGPNQEEVKKDGRKSHNKKLRKFYS